MPSGKSSFKKTKVTVKWRHILNKRERMRRERRRKLLMFE